MAGIVLAEDYYRVLDIMTAIHNGERSEFLAGEIYKIQQKHADVIKQYKEKYKNHI